MKKSLESLNSKKFNQIQFTDNVNGGREACSWNSNGTCADDADVTKGNKTDWGYQEWSWDDKIWYKKELNDKSFTLIDGLSSSDATLFDNDATSMFFNEAYAF
jgi:hypothetical protein